jgi:hypothetical protein
MQGGHSALAADIHTGWDQGALREPSRLEAGPLFRPDPGNAIMSRRHPFNQFEHLLGDEPPEEICHLVHFDPPYIPYPGAPESECAGHYLGKTKDLCQRDGQHGTASGARILQVQKEAGGTWHLVRTWAGGGDKERQLKTRAGKAYCPDCNEHPLPGDTPPRKGAKYLTRKMRRERQAIREARENDPWKDLEMQEITSAQLREKLGRFPGPAAPELPYEKQLRRIEELEATWRRAAPPQMELEAG